MNVHECMDNCSGDNYCPTVLVPWTGNFRSHQSHPGRDLEASKYDTPQRRDTVSAKSMLCRCPWIESLHGNLDTILSFSPLLHPRSTLLYMLPMQSTHNVACQCQKGPFSAGVCVFVTIMVPWALELAFNCLTCRREVSCECVAMVLVALIEDDLQMSPRVPQLKATKRSQLATINFHRHSTFHLSVHLRMCLLVCSITSPQHQIQNYFAMMSTYQRTWPFHVEPCTLQANWSATRISAALALAGLLRYPQARRKGNSKMPGQHVLHRCLQIWQTCTHNHVPAYMQTKYNVYNCKYTQWCACR